MSHGEMSFRTFMTIGIVATLLILLLSMIQAGSISFTDEKPVANDSKEAQTIQSVIKGDYTITKVNLTNTTKGNVTMLKISPKVACDGNKTLAAEGKCGTCIGACGPFKRMPTTTTTTSTTTTTTTTKPGSKV